MRCRHAQTHTERINAIGQAPEVIQQTLCRLKMQSRIAQTEVYGKLLELGLEGSMITNSCPLAVQSNWKECPFYEPGK